MNQPKRIQLSRKKGWRLPENTVVVSRPSKWGNPWKVKKDVKTAAEAVDRYRRLLSGNVWSFPNKESIQKELRGKNLACWCKESEPCHADVLLEIANSKGANE